MSQEYISLSAIFMSGFFFHYFQKICERDYIKAKQDFNLFLNENQERSGWDYNLKKHKMDMNKARKWCSLIFKYICFVSSIFGFIDSSF